jgi:hypothetical protein
VTPLAAALVLAVALAAGEGRARGAAAAPQGASAANAARAKMGLLPRKAPPPRAAPARRGRVLDTSRHQPTFLAEPGAGPASPDLAARPAPVAHVAPSPQRAAPAERADEVRVALAGVVTDVAIVLRYDR